MVSACTSTDHNSFHLENVTFKKVTEFGMLGGVRLPTSQIRISLENRDAFEVVEIIKFK